MASLVQCFQAIKISLNTKEKKKRETVIFKTPHTYFSKKTNNNVSTNLNFRISGQKHCLVI